MIVALPIVAAKVTWSVESVTVAKAAEEGRVDVIFNNMEFLQPLHWKTNVDKLQANPFVPDQDLVNVGDVVVTTECKASSVNVTTPSVQSEATDNCVQAKEIVLVEDANVRPDSKDQIVDA